MDFSILKIIGTDFVCDFCKKSRCFLPLDIDAAEHYIEGFKVEHKPCVIANWNQKYPDDECED